MKKQRLQEENTDLNHSSCIFNENEILMLDPSAIVIHPTQPRKKIDNEKLYELQESIKEHGIIQPLVVQIQENIVFLVAGQQRRIAAMNIGLKEVPCVVKEGDIGVMSLIENIQRDNLAAMDIAESIGIMLNKPESTISSIGKKISMKQASIYQYLKLYDLPTQIKRKCFGDKRFSKKKLLEFTKYSDKELQERKFEEFFQSINSEKNIAKKKKNRKKNRQKDEILLNDVPKIISALKKVTEDISYISDNSKEELYKKVLELREQTDIFLKELLN